MADESRMQLRLNAAEFASERDAAKRDTLRAIEDRNAAIEALRMTEHHLREEQRLREHAEAARRQAEMDLADAVAWIRVVGEECILAGMPGGDRTVILANIRRALQALPKRRDFPCIDEWACMMPGDCERHGRCLAADKPSAPADDTADGRR